MTEEKPSPEQLAKDIALVEQAQREMGAFMFDMIMNGEAILWTIPEETP